MVCQGLMMSVTLLKYGDGHQQLRNLLTSIELWIIEQFSLQIICMK
uniref:Uncharacterized protein n=1 Tax=Anguilla anguilla TaxID=7936 RepID=A0A0E9WSE2_ANGAN